MVSRATGWALLPPEQRTAWAALGWSEESWSGKGLAPMSSLQYWEELTPAQRGAAAHGLGYTEELWDAERGHAGQRRKAGALGQARPLW